MAHTLKQIIVFRN